MSKPVIGKRNVYKYSTIILMCLLATSIFVTAQITPSITLSNAGISTTGKVVGDTVETSGGPNAPYSYMIYVVNATHYAAKAANGTICWTSTNCLSVLTSATSSNKNIIFGVGEFYISPSLAIGTFSNLTISGSGKELTVFHVLNGNSSYFALFSFYGTQRQNIKLQDFSVDLGNNQYATAWAFSASASYSVSGVQISNIAVYNGQATSSYSGPFINNAQNVWVTDCYFDNLYNVGGGTGLNYHFERNSISNCYNNGLVVPGNNQVYVINNNITNSAYGIDTGGSSDAFIYDNHISNTVGSNTGYAINVEPTVGTSTVKISRNTIDISIAGKNAIGSVSSYATVISGLEITENTITYSGSGSGAGVLVNNVTNSKIIGNTITGSNNPLDITLFSNGKIDLNTITAASCNYGIQAYAIINSSISQNNFYGQINAILMLLVNSGTTNSSLLLIANNYASVTLSGGWQGAFQLSQTSNATFTGNTIMSISGNSLSVRETDNTSNFNFYFGNTFSNFNQNSGAPAIAGAQSVAHDNYINGAWVA
jgi:hypothetical protein